MLSFFELGNQTVSGLVEKAKKKNHQTGYGMVTSKILNLPVND